MNDGRKLFNRSKLLSHILCVYFNKIDIWIPCYTKGLNSSLSAFLHSSCVFVERWRGRCLFLNKENDTNQKFVAVFVVVNRSPGF